MFAAATTPVLCTFDIWQNFIASDNFICYVLYFLVFILSFFPRTVFATSKINQMACFTLFFVVLWYFTSFIRPSDLSLSITYNSKHGLTEGISVISDRAGEFASPIPSNPLLLSKLWTIKMNRLRPTRAHLRHQTCIGD